jgi:hypothetical protein
MVRPGRLGTTLGWFRQRMVIRISAEAQERGKSISKGMLGGRDGDMEGSASVVHQCGWVSRYELHQPPRARKRQQKKAIQCAPDSQDNNQSYGLVVSHHQVFLGCAHINLDLPDCAEEVLELVLDE